MNPYIATFLDKLESEDKSNYTITSYRDDLNGFELWLKGSCRKALEPKCLDFKTIKAYRDYLINKQKAKPATINRKFSSLSRFCQIMVSKGLMLSDPTTEIKAVRNTQLSPKSLIEGDLQAFLEAVEHGGNPRDIAIAQLFANTGIRVGELASLTLKDIKRGTVTIRWGKGGNSRVIPLNKNAGESLEAYLKVRPKTEEEHLFIGQRGNGLGRFGIWVIINKYGKAAGVDLSPHTLRHTLAKKVVNKPGNNLVTAKTILGHVSLTTTARYSLPSEKDIEKGLKDLPELEIKISKRQPPL